MKSMAASAKGCRPARFRTRNRTSSGPWRKARVATCPDGPTRDKGRGRRHILMYSYAASSLAMDRETEILRRLSSRYGPQSWWPAENAFEVIVGALLMPQTTWRNVAAAIR